MTQVVFHSDDAGATRHVTSRIMDVWTRGLIDSFSVLANGEALSELSVALESHPETEARIAVHLNLCEGLSLAHAGKATLISDDRGNLSGTFGGLLKHWLFSSRKEKKLLQEQVETEWRAQIESVVEVCSPRQVQVLDGHMHLHMLPFLFPIAARLAAEYNIPEIRVTDEVFHLSKNPSESMNLAFAINVIKHIVLRVCAKMVTKHLGEYNLATPDTMIGVLYTGRMTAASASRGISVAKKKNKKIVEVLFHVGRGLESESDRWANCPDIGQFYLDERRDVEFRELEKLRAVATSKLSS